MHDLCLILSWHMRTLGKPHSERPPPTRNISSRWTLEKCCACSGCIHSSSVFTSISTIATSGPPTQLGTAGSLPRLWLLPGIFGKRTQEYAQLGNLCIVQPRFSERQDQLYSFPATAQIPRITRVCQAVCSVYCMCLLVLSECLALLHRSSHSFGQTCELIS